MSKRNPDQQRRSARGVKSRPSGGPKPDASGRRGVILKSVREIELMRRSGGLVGQVLDAVAEQTKPGVTTGALNELAEKMIADAGAAALFKGVVNPQASFPFPAALCMSVNEEVVHGVPGDRELCDGDVLSADCGVRLDGYCGDSARTIPVGVLAEDVARLLDITEETLNLAIREIRPDRPWCEVAVQMQRFVEDAGFSVVRDFVGHGIGQEMHEEPKVPNYCDRKQLRTDFRLRAGMTLAIEPMVTMGSHAVEYSGPGAWAVVTRDGKFAAHFEHTIAVTEHGADVLTVSN